MEKSVLLEEYQYPLFASVAYILTIYRFIAIQRDVKYRAIVEFQKEGKKFDRYYSKHPPQLAADRILGNYLEQTPPFLLSMWCSALFVDATFAGLSGIFWVFLRNLYPFFMGPKLARNNPKGVYFSTLPSYIIVFLNTGRILVSLLCCCPSSSPQLHWILTSLFVISSVVLFALSQKHLIVSIKSEEK